MQQTVGQELRIISGERIALNNERVSFKQVQLQNCDVILQEDIDLSKCVEASIISCQIEMRGYRIIGGHLHDCVLGC
jgi:hypothetical protein